MSEFIASSGAKIKINPAPFVDAMGLKNALARQLASADLKIDFDVEKDLDLSSLTSAILAVDASADVYKAIFTCLGRCSYNGERINELTFEPVESREDYYEIIIACARENLSPFFKNLTSKLSPLVAKIQGLKEKNLS